MSFLRPSRPAFAVALGLATTVLVGIPAAMVFGVGFPSLLPLSLALAAGVVITTTGLSSPALPGALVRTRLHTAVVLSTMVAFLSASALAPALGAAGDFLAQYSTALVATIVAGGLFYLCTINRYAAQLLERGSPIAEWRARPDDRYRRRVRVVGFAASIALFSSVLFVDLPGRELRVSVASGLLVQSLLRERPKTYRLYEEGLLVETSRIESYSFVPANELGPVERTDGALSIRRSLPWPFPVRCDVGYLDSPDELTRRLQRHLDR